MGPNHIIATVNSEFSIYDKEGNELKNIDAGQWFQPVTQYQRGDPQVIYDHYSSRWVIQFMEQNDAAQVAGNLIAISDDDNPLGDWYIYRMDTRSHGTILPQIHGVIILKWVMTMKLFILLPASLDFQVAFSAVRLE